MKREEMSDRELLIKAVPISVVIFILWAVIDLESLILWGKILLSIAALFFTAGVLAFANWVMLILIVTFIKFSFNKMINKG